MTQECVYERHGDIVWCTMHIFNRAHLNVTSFKQANAIFIFVIKILDVFFEYKDREFSYAINLREFNYK